MISLSFQARNFPPFPHFPQGISLHSLISPKEFPSIPSFPQGISLHALISPSVWVKPSISWGKVPGVSPIPTPLFPFVYLGSLTCPQSLRIWGSWEAPGKGRALGRFQVYPPVLFLSSPLVYWSFAPSPCPQSLRIWGSWILGSSWEGSRCIPHSHSLLPLWFIWAVAPRPVLYPVPNPCGFGNPGSRDLPGGASSGQALRNSLRRRFDVTESVLCTVAIQLLSGILGPWVWNCTIPILNIQVKIFPALCTVAGTIFSCTNYFGVIFTGGVGKNGSTIAGTSVLSPFLHIGAVLALAVMIYKKSAVQLFERHPCLYILTFGCVSAKITNKLVVAHMTKSEMHLYDTAFLGPALLFLDQYFNSFIDEYLVLWIALVLSLLDLLRYCVSVCSQIAAHLHIHVFRIQGRPSHSNHH
ncbi:choline/ethanolaminephosphotransferase 1 isoform X4 [Manacus candei]|uniref:choline/ethanolaminephosphotransferase 1 isoform X4 n=1 Tax=Manacus candei TaxID=415023 RepID=UPI0022266846|nr:choline/ethanolaminephosphotransferase 1 isoform X4 [Manacus candei]